MTTEARAPFRWADPYVTGVGIGLVLLAAFVIAGRGLGAIGGFGSVAAAAVRGAAPAHAAASAWYAPFATGPSPLLDWLALELGGVALGAFVSASLAGRRRANAADSSGGGRLMAAAGGGLVMGVGARLARGCTSGLVLSGGASLAVSGWLFAAGACATALLTVRIARGIAT